jgi:uncharacterized membrane protein YkvA (DUF1232 family)
VTAWQWLLLSLAVTATVYAAFVGGLIIGGRRADALAVTRFIPDCIVLVQRLLRDAGVPRRRKLLLLALVAYLAMPLDLVPDFIPIAGQLDDAILVALVLRALLRGGGEDIVSHHWPGPDHSLRMVLSFAGVSRARIGGGRRGATR